MMNADNLPTLVLSRKAVVYVRQSTQTQVQVHLESQRRQYDLVDEARRRGFQDVEVIDDDLGRSASGTITKNRPCGVSRKTFRFPAAFRRSFSASPKCPMAAVWSPCRKAIAPDIAACTCGAMPGTPARPLRTSSSRACCKSCDKRAGRRDSNSG